MDNVIEWVKKAQSGNEEAFGELVKMYHQRIYNLVYGMVNNADDAKELSQQAWIKAWNKIGSFRADSQFFTWIYRIASNQCLDFFRSRGRRREVLWNDRKPEEDDRGIDEIARDSSQPDREVLNAESRDLFFRALETLTPEHKLALTLREVDGLSYEEIAEVMKCRKGTVMSRIFYARKTLAEKMRDAK